LKVNPQIAELLHGEENKIISALERKIDQQIVIYPNSKLHIEEYEIIASQAI
jgi:ribonuclease G